MRNIIKTLTASCCLLATSTFAAEIGTVDMTKIFHNPKQLAIVKTQLQAKFGGKQDSMKKMVSTLQSDLANYEKNKTVMKKSDLAALKKKIATEEATLRKERASFQQQLFAAQAKMSKDFYTKVKAQIKTVALRDKLNLVLPNTMVLYSGKSKDITDEVMNKL